VVNSDQRFTMPRVADLIAMATARQRTPLLCPANPGMRSEEPRLPRGRCERLEKPTSGRPPLVQEHTGLEELLASCVVRQMMKKDGVDPSYVRKLIASVAAAIAQAP